MPGVITYCPEFGTLDAKRMVLFQGEDSICPPDVIAHRFVDGAGTPCLNDLGEREGSQDEDRA